MSFPNALFYKMSVKILLFLALSIIMWSLPQAESLILG
jgi:hypothetical protein